METGMFAGAGAKPAQLHETCMGAHRLSWSLIACVVTLVLLGCMGIARAEELAGGDGGRLRQQVVWALASMVCMTLMTGPNYRMVCRHSYALFVGTLVLLIGVYFFPPIHGVHRWIRWGRVGFQPSEFAKVTFVLAVARYLMYRENYRRWHGLFAPILLALIPIVLILREPDLGTACVFLPVLLTMLYAAGAPKRDLALVLIGCLATAPLIWAQMSREQRSRITAFLEPAVAGERPGPDAYHLHQARQMLALGGIWGSYFRGEATGDRGTVHVPEAATDSIFVVLGERFGKLGVAVVLSAYVLLAWRGLAIASATREPFGRLVATGIVSLIGIEASINTSMLVGLMPITGISLPLVSYGGSGLLAHGVAMGLVLNIGMRPGYEVAREPFRHGAR